MILTLFAHASLWIYLGEAGSRQSIEFANPSHFVECMNSNMAPVIRAPRILYFVPGGGFQLEAKSLLDKIHCAHVELVLPSDSVLSDWMNGYTVWRLPPVTTRARPSVWRRIRRMFNNLTASMRLIDQSTPEFIICVGSSICIPAFLIGRVKGVRCIFVESLARVDDLSRTGRLIEVLRLADRLYVQWPEMIRGHKRRHYEGAVV